MMAINIGSLTPEQQKRMDAGEFYFLELMGFTQEQCIAGGDKPCVYLKTPTFELDTSKRLEPYPDAVGTQFYEEYLVCDMDLVPPPTDTELLERVAAALKSQQEAERQSKK